MTVSACCLFLYPCPGVARKSWHSFLPTFHSHYILNTSSILVISGIQYNVSRNRVSDDANHVNDVSIVIKIPKESLSKFKPLRIRDGLRHDLNTLSQHVFRTLYDIFSLFFTFDIIQHLIDYTNRYVANL